MQTLVKFKQFVDEITADNSRLYKESILLKYKDDEDIKYYLNFLLNPYIVTGISDKKLARMEHLDRSIFPKTIKAGVKNLLEYIKQNNTGTDAVIAYIHQFMYITWQEVAFGLFTYDTECLNDSKKIVELNNFLKKIIIKNLPLGVDTKTVNKIIPGLIPTFNVMLANKYFDNPKVIEGKEFAITTKIDGMRCIMLKENGNVTFWSRQGQQIEGLVDLVEEAKCFPDNICLDGELIAIVDNSDTYKDTMKIARTKDTEKHGLKMMVFDCMSIEDFKSQFNEQEYGFRRLLLNRVWNRRAKNKAIFQCGGIEFGFDTSELEVPTIETCKSAFNYFELLPILYQGTDTSKIIELLDEQTSKGEEGIMINIVDAPYEFKRTNQLLKVKKFQDTEIKVIGFEAGINRLSGTLGALICNYKGNTVKVGSGFPDELRKAIWEHQEEWLNKIITVKYFEESYDSKTGQKSLRFPIYMRVREDI